MTVQEQKQALRRETGRRVATLPPGYLDRAGREISARIATLPEYVRADTVFAFVSTPREADTRPLLEQVLRDGKRLAVPLCMGQGIMDSREVTDLGRLRPGKYGIWEPPADSPVVLPSEVQLVAAPCLACDASGRRLGHGGGYYDRYLSRYAGAALVVCPDRLLLEHVPQEPGDRAVSIVVTEKAVFRRT